MKPKNIKKDKSDNVTEKISEVEGLHYTIKLMFKIMFWISIFLLIPTIGYYIKPWVGIQYARDTGIILIFISLWRINRRIKKKEKEKNGKNQNN